MPHALLDERASQASQPRWRLIEELLKLKTGTPVTLIRFRFGRV